MVWRLREQGDNAAPVPEQVRVRAYPGCAWDVFRTYPRHDRTGTGGGEMGAMGLWIRIR